MAWRSKVISATAPMPIRCQLTWRSESLARNSAILASFFQPRCRVGRRIPRRVDIPNRIALYQIFATPWVIDGRLVCTQFGGFAPDRTLDLDDVAVLFPVTPPTGG